MSKKYQKIPDDANNVIKVSDRMKLMFEKKNSRSFSIQSFIADKCKNSPKSHTRQSSQEVDKMTTINKGG